MLKLEKRQLKVNGQSVGGNRVNHPFTFRRSSCYRKNVLDLLNVFGGRAKTAYMLVDIDMSAIEASRVQHDLEGHHLTVTAYLIKAIGIAQRSHPDSRTFSLPFGRTVTFNDVVAGFTVEREVDGEPIVFFGEIAEPHLKSLEEIAAELKTYSSGDLMSVSKLRQQMTFARFPRLIRQVVLLAGLWFPALRLICMGATFGLSSFGALGVSSVCGPSVCTAVFGVGACENRLVVRNGEVLVRPIMSLSLSWDQNVMDCAGAARFLQTIKRLLDTGALAG